MSEEEAQKLGRFIVDLERVVRAASVNLVMMHLMVLQLDGSVTIDDDTVRRYLVALEGNEKAVKSFIVHVRKYLGRKE